jgi:uncharacterized protein (TIGR02147 family)
VNASVYNFSDYKDYLNSALATSGPSRGQRSRLADVLGCQTAFISKVLNGPAHFSLEHAAQISIFLQQSDEERSYFLLLVQHGRAGSRLLQEHFAAELKKLREKRKLISNRIDQPRTLGHAEQVLYYSSWHYVAIHVLVSIHRYATRNAVADYLKLPLSRTAECLDSLVQWGVLSEENGRYRVRDVRIHLGKDSAMLGKHHSNWRIQAINSLDRKSDEDLHYSSVISLSENDARKIRELLLATIEKSDAIMRPSPEEGAFCLLMDFFRL